MQKEIAPFSETLNDDFEDVFLDALAQERSAIQEIEQEKEEKLLNEKVTSAPIGRKKLWRDTQKEALARLKDSA